VLRAAYVPPLTGNRTTRTRGSIARQRSSTASWSAGDASSMISTSRFAQDCASSDRTAVPNPTPGRYDVTITEIRSGCAIRGTPAVVSRSNGDPAGGPAGDPAGGPAGAAPAVGPSVNRIRASGSSAPNSASQRCAAPPAAGPTNGFARSTRSIDRTPAGTRRYVRSSSRVRSRRPRHAASWAWKPW
jgi:hypothetical protein